jgi:hypothetical protein
MTDGVLEAASKIALEKPSFTAEDFFEKLIGKECSTEEEIWRARKNITTFLTRLERTKIISGEFKFEFTKNFGLPLEVRQGQLTKLGRLIASSPKAIRYSYFGFFLFRKKILSVLGLLAFFNLARNAYLGAALIAGWKEYLSIGVLMALILSWLHKQL